MIGLALVILVAIGLSVLGRETWGWLPRVSHRVIWLHTMALPKARRALRRAEWCAELEREFEDRRVTGLLWAISVSRVSIWERATGPGAFGRVPQALVAGIGLLALLPLLTLAALAISLESRGGVLYRQRRVGQDGREFDVLKLRTMIHGAEDLAVYRAEYLAAVPGAADALVTSVGRILRRSSLNHLPILINVLRGEMSIVGPRPMVPSQVALFTPRELGRLAVKPGVTGWAQVNGAQSLAEGIELDLWYIEHRSWRLDLKILLRSSRLFLERSPNLSAW